MRPICKSSGKRTRTTSRRHKKSKKANPESQLSPELLIHPQDQVNANRETRMIPYMDEVNLEKEQELLEKIFSSRCKMESSRFYQQFLDQIQNPITMTYFSSVLSSESQMSMVIYGIGSIEKYEKSRLQLSLAMLLREKFDWIGDVEIFDPVLRPTELRVLKDLEFKVFPFNEGCRRKVKRPTFFFMLHCAIMLYDNLLAVNWQADSLKKIVIFGNSFERYQKFIVDNQSPLVSCSKHILEARMFSKEIKIVGNLDEFPDVFQFSSLHFFDLDPEIDMESLIITDEE